ncbi:MAG: hypothetical protein VYB34_16910 [Planctomycetota bacterium]|nr:hypothetical protein [Planctomycetota bacterium]
MKHPLLLILFCLCIVSPLEAQRLGGVWGTSKAEEEFYPVRDLSIPPELALEVGSFTLLPDGRLAIGTRRGEILLVSGAFDRRPKLRVERFASGLDEVFGLGYRDGAFYATQQAEVTRIRDVDGDGRADVFDTLSDKWGFGNYHEFSWGSEPDPDGNIWVVLGLSNSYHYRADFRGWSFKITPDGKTIPIASGIRSAGGVAPNEHGEMFYVESQGPWNGSCSLKHLKPGGFMGHPISFEAYKAFPELGPRPVEPKSQSRIHIEKKRVKELVPYAVIFPYRKMGQSISGFRVDRTGGKFGPFAGQIFVGDYSLSCIMRATTEKVNGVWQGACYPFREGLGTGLLAIQFSPEGYLVAGGTNRGWPVRGTRSFILERLEWSGKVPFEIKRINIRPKGFALTFTRPFDPKVATDASLYKLEHFTHIYHKFYGSPEVDQGAGKVVGVKVSPDGLVANLELEGVVEGHVYEFDLSGIKSAAGKPLVHTRAYYTVNEIPNP